MEDKKFDKYELEQSIMDCWHIVDDLKTIAKKVDAMDSVQVKNILLSLGDLYQLKFENLFEQYESVLFPQISNEFIEAMPKDPLFDVPWHNS